MAKNADRKWAQKQMSAIFRLYNGTCYYCRRPVVSLRWLNRRGFSVVRRTAGNVTFTRDGRHETLAIATIDHDVPLGGGGPRRHRGNLVLACWKCNNDRNNKVQKASRGARQKGDDCG